MTALISTTLIALAVIGVSGAALLMGDVTFAQFASLVGVFGGGTSALHILGTAKSSA